jgi:hypothetical protein
MRVPLALALALLAVIGGCADDIDLTGPAPTPFWMEDADAGQSADGGPSDAAGQSDAAAPGDTAGQTDAAAQGDSDALADSGGPTDAAAVPDTADADDVGPSADAADSANPDTGDAGGSDIAPASEDQYFVSWAESAQQLQDPSPFGSSWAEQRTTTLGLVKISWQGDSGTRWLQPCAMHTNTVFGTKTLYSAGFLSAIPVPGVPISRVGKLWSQSEEFVVVGLKEGYDGAMPALGQKDHAALVDSDKDGLPGVTVHIDNNLLGKQNLQVAQRQRSTWTAEVQANGEIAAQPKVTSEQVVVAASMNLLVVQNKTKPVSGKPGETLRFVPLTAPIDCKALLASPSKYAGKTWPP